jgi:hypothetical protein
MSARPTTCGVELHLINKAMSFRQTNTCQWFFAHVADEITARRLERYFKSGSGKAFAKKRFLTPAE